MDERDRCNREITPAIAEEKTIFERGNLCEITGMNLNKGIARVEIIANLCLQEQTSAMINGIALFEASSP
jgi:hypothetical protein